MQTTSKPCKMGDLTGLSLRGVLEATTFVNTNGFSARGLILPIATSTQDSLNHALSARMLFFPLFPLSVNSIFLKKIAI